MDQGLQLAAGLLVLVVSASFLGLAVRAVYRGLRGTAEERAETLQGLREFALEALIYLVALGAGVVWLWSHYAASV